MGEEFPKRLFAAGSEPLVGHVNNSCRVTLLGKIKDAVPAEYRKVKRNPVFAPILAIEENGLGYSGKLVHSMLTRQLVTKKKFEIWCVFGGRPLRFSLQEFHAVTGLKIDGESEIADVVNKKRDNGFWSTLLKEKRKISMKSIIHDVLPHVQGWEKRDKIRLVYVSVIAVMLMAIDEKKSIPHKYINLVMDLEKLNDYPWGRVSFEHLVRCIAKAKEKLKNPLTYLLEGFSYAFQIWAMEAVPAIGAFVGTKIDKEQILGPRCANWKGCYKVSYDQLIGIEETMKNTDDVYAYISSTGNLDVYEAVEFSWPNELSDVGVVNLKRAISRNSDFGGYLWETYKPEDDDDEHDVGEDLPCNEDGGEESDGVGEESDGVGEEIGSDVEDDTAVSGSRKKKRIPDHGVEKR